MQGESRESWFYTLVHARIANRLCPLEDHEIVVIREREGVCWLGSGSNQRRREGDSFSFLIVENENEAGFGE